MFMSSSHTQAGGLIYEFYWETACFFLVFDWKSDTWSLKKQEMKSENIKPRLDIIVYRCTHITLQVQL